jgi:uncharacterized protein YjbJ (UPF0337 family)
MKGDHMNKDQVKGVLKETAGAIQKKGGEVLGNPMQQAKGVLKEVQGKAQKNLGDMEEAIKNVNKKG